MRMKSLKTALVAGTAMVVASLAGSPAQAEIDTRNFTVVGTWGNLDNWLQFEKPFWEEVIPEASDGKITANARPYTELGLSGFEVMRMLSLGTYDAVHALTGYVAQDSPALEGLDLAGVFQDFDTFEAAVEVYRSIIARELEDKYNAKLLNLYSFPTQQLWCNLGDAGEDVSLDDLAGLRIRTYSTTLGDFIEGLGATSVTIPFAEVVPALQRGVAECGITGAMPAYNASWYQVVTHNIRVRLGFAATFTAVNLDTWNELSPETQELLETKAMEMERELMAFNREFDEVGMACNAHGPCPEGEPGGMTPIELDEAGWVKLEEIVENFVLQRWAERCGVECAQEWNDTIGTVVPVNVPL